MKETIYNALLFFAMRAKQEVPVEKAGLKFIGNIQRKPSKKGSLLLTYGLEHKPCFCPFLRKWAV